jgi:hypothetical protein
MCFIQITYPCITIFDFINPKGNTNDINRWAYLDTSILSMDCSITADVTGSIRDAYFPVSFIFLYCHQDFSTGIKYTVLCRRYAFVFFQAACSSNGLFGLGVIRKLHYSFKNTILCILKEESK